MKLLHTSDWHLGISTELGDRLPEANASFNALIGDAIGAQVDAVVLAGDVFDTRRPGPRELAVFARAIAKLSELGIPTIVTPGNHDGPEAINQPEGKTTAWLAELDLPSIHAFSTAQVATIDTKSGPLQVAVLPYPHKRSFDRLAIPSIVEASDRTAEVAGATEDLIADLCGQLAPGHAPRLLVAHVSVVGAVLGQGQAMQMGWDVTLRPRAFRGFDYVALGHIHVDQQVAPNAAYCGTPMRLGWPDAGRSVGWKIVEFGEGRSPEITHHYNPAARELAIMTEPLDEQDLSGSVEEGAYVRVRVQRRASARELRALERRLLDAGASWARASIELPPETNRRRTTIDPNATVEEHLRAYLASINVADESEIERVLKVAFELALD